MKTSIAFLVGVMVGVTGLRAEVCIPAQPEPLIVKTGISGRPPSFVIGEWPEGADQIQIEVVIVTSDGTDKPVARVFVDPTTCYLNPITVDGQRKTEVFIRGPSLTGFAMFYQAGQYKAHWRGYSEECEFGEWSEFTPFERDFVSRPVTTITRGLSRVSWNRDVMFRWRNNFADEVWTFQILYGRRAIRNVFGRGSFREGWMYEGDYTYRDRPESPDDELPNSEFLFKVRAWCPISRQWSEWAQKPFEIARGTLPRVPSIMVTQRDFNGWFNRSSRPRFLARYGHGHTPALWTLFDIRRLINGRQRRIALRWVSRYASARDGAGVSRIDPSIISLRGENIFYDLPPGTYVWRVRAHNGHSQWWDGSRRRNYARWSNFRTNVIEEPGTLPRPVTTSMKLWNGTTKTDGSWVAEDPEQPEVLSWSGVDWQLEGKMIWRTVRKGFVYNLRIYRDNELYAVYNQLDPRTHDNVRMSRSGKSMLFFREPFPPGVYRFRFQAYNRANHPRKRHSAWSAFSPEFVIP